MTTALGPTHAGIMFTSFLPDPLPDGEAVKTAAKEYTTHGTTMDDAYVETNTTWGTLPENFQIPEPDMATTLTALRDMVEPLGAAVVDGIDDIESAMDAYGDAIVGFKTTHQRLRERVDEYNALPPTEFTASQKSEAIEDGESLPTTRTETRRAVLETDLHQAQEEYEGYIDTCVSAIEAATPAVVKDQPANVTANIKLIQKSYELAATWSERGAAFRGAGQGRMRFIWRADVNTLSDFVKDGVPGWKAVHTEGTWLNKAPGWFKNRIPDPANFTDLNAVKAMDSWYESGITKMSHASDRFRGMLMASMPAPVFNQLDKLKNSRAGKFLSLNSVKKVNGKWKVEVNVGGKRSYLVPEKIRSQMGKFDKANDFFKKVGDNPVVKNGGKVLGALDMGATYYESYGNNYNEALRENPNGSPDAVRNEAITSTAIEGTAENAGKVVGGVVGRAAGAALGQALIPIPGVGAAVGGFVGGVVGDYVGGKVGAAAGEFINDWRQGGADKAFGDAGKAIGDAGKAIGDGVKDVASSIGKKLFGW